MISVLIIVIFFAFSLSEQKQLNKFCLHSRITLILLFNYAFWKRNLLMRRTDCVSKNSWHVFVLKLYRKKSIVFFLKKTHIIKRKYNAIRRVSHDFLTIFIWVFWANQRRRNCTYICKRSWLVDDIIMHLIFASSWTLLKHKTWWE